MLLVIGYRARSEERASDGRSVAAVDTYRHLASERCLCLCLCCNGVPECTLLTYDWSVVDGEKHRHGTAHTLRSSLSSLRDWHPATCPVLCTRDRPFFPAAMATVEDQPTNQPTKEGSP